MTHEVAEAAAQGDRSENAEYIYGKKKLREIDRRMQYLAHRLDKLTV
ncbi:MAG TPA: transcription elongation factor GreB, partial [Polyangiaceae bacterium]|nr:transcription elongation factor GreB [Polyangiaceae bacterium]